MTFKFTGKTIHGGWSYEKTVKNGKEVIRLRKKQKFNDVLITLAKAKNHPTFNSPNLRYGYKGEPVIQVPNGINPEEIIVSIGQNARTVWTTTDLMDFGLILNEALAELGYKVTR